MRRDLLPLQLVVALLLALRLYYDFTADLFGDEAYYYLWGQHLSWSYFDHPPLHAWLIRIVTTLLPGALGLRALMWLTLAGTLSIFWSWSKRLAPNDRQRWFWTGAAIYLASPLFFGFTLIAYHDHLLIFLSLAAIHCFALFVESRALRWLYLAAIALGLATLTKYTGVFVGFGFAAAFVVRKDLRPLLLTPHPWLAALLAAGIQAPVIYWNITEGMASFRFHLDGRWNGNAGKANWYHPVRFVVLSLAVWSPFLIWPLVKLIRGRIAGAFESGARTVALATLAISTMILLVVAVYLDAFFYWSIVGFVGLMPLLVSYTRRVTLWLHLVFGLVCAALIVVNFAVIPIAAIGGGRDPASGMNFGWSEIAAHVRAEQAEAPVDFVGAPRYYTASQLGLALGITDPGIFSPEHSQYDYWPAHGNMTGKSALILVDELEPDPIVAWLREHFATLDEVDDFSIDRFGHELYRWRLFRGEGFRPSP